MGARAEIEAGVCGFRTTAVAASEDGQMVTFVIESNCEKVTALAGDLLSKQPFDAYEEIKLGSDGKIMTCVRDSLKGCCAGCAVPAGIFKAMQVAAELALPRDITIRIAKT